MKKLLIVSTFVLAWAGGVEAVPFPGPDGFGYQGSVIPFNLRDVSASGIDIGLDDSDGDTAVVPIGFSFDFYGISYTQVEVSSNGFISFTQTGNSGCCSGDPIPTAGNIDNYIAGWWEDLDPSESLSGIIRTRTIGPAGAREFIVGFYNVPDYDDPINSINTFEIILHEVTNDIELQLAQIQFDDVDDKVTGIENTNGTDGIQVAFVPDSALLANGDFVFSHDAFCFSTGGTNCGVTSGSIPEPATLALFGLGLAGLRLGRRRVSV